MPEIVSINQADQFVGDHTAYACGFFAVMMCASISPPGQAATKSPSQISNDALAAYARYNGSNSASNSAGMSLPQLYSLLHEVGLHYQGTVLDLAHIRAWLLSGFPVIVAVAETCVHDLDLGDRVPYPWNPSGNHVIVLTGLDGDNVLARDSANIAAAPRSTPLRCAHTGRRSGIGDRDRSTVEGATNRRYKPHERSSHARTHNPSARGLERRW